jgi:glycosyltransferase involved in cell wall biosynthesis
MAITGNAAIISLHFSPAHASHMIAYGKLLREIGYAVCFMLDKKYLSITDFTAVGNVFIKGSCNLNRISEDLNIAIFCNNSTENVQFARTFSNYGTKILYVFHEPGSVRSMLPEGWKQTLRFCISSHYSIKVLKRSSSVILPSEFAMAMYDKNFSKYNRNAFVLPLAFDDEIGSTRFYKELPNKRYFEFVGNAVKGHGIDEYIGFAKYALRNGSSIPFLLATKTDLSLLLANDKELSRYAQEGKIEIHHGHTFSNDEIDEFYLRGFCVWNVYRRTTQSGVLPRAFMAGTPVLARRIGSFPEYVKPGVTGEFINAEDPFSNWLKTVESMYKKINEYSTACREMFFQTFYYMALTNQFKSMLIAPRIEDKLK